MEPAEFCREIETYLCKKNDGHLIRVVGPSFELVSGWAERGVPLKVAFRGIDRYCERYYRQGPRRRPVRIDFCEADVLDVFDEWRRAVGVAGSGPESESGAGSAERGADPSGPRNSLPAHLDRVIARLTAMRAGGDRSLDAVIDAAVQQLDAARSAAKSARGDARDALLARLTELDASMLTALRDRCDAQTRQQLEAEADEELHPYRARLPADAYRESHRAAVDRLLRERARLPRIDYE